MIWLPVVGNYVDIDVYASIIAYTDLLTQRGKLAKTYIPVAPNYSVPEALRLPEQENKTFDLQPGDGAIILDVSIPDVIHRLASDNQILELIDHHPGYEEYWHERIGDKAIIEPIGAVATSIFEWWGECWDYAKMSPEIAKLLLGAILDNTLNFNAQITTERDRNAARRLAKRVDTTVEKFAAWYFSEVSRTIISNLQNAISKDCKIIKSPVDNSDFTFGQLALWDARKLIKRDTKIAKVVQAKASSWVVNIISISERKNYLLTSSEELSQYFSKLLKLHPEENWLLSDQLYLRKEIIGKMLKKNY